jgi:hypothetical protein
MFHQLWQHLQVNWHKYGIAILVLNHIIEKMRSFKENALWIKKGANKLFKKMGLWLHLKK